MSITNVDFTKGNNLIKSIFLVVSQNKSVLMTIEEEEMSYESIHIEYVKNSTVVSIVETDSPSEYFEAINKRLAKLMSSTLYKATLHRNILDELLGSEQGNDFDSWHDYLVSFLPEEINISLRDTVPIKSMKMY